MARSNPISLATLGQRGSAARTKPSTATASAQPTLRNLRIAAAEGDREGRKNGATDIALGNFENEATEIAHKKRRNGATRFVIENHQNGATRVAFEISWNGPMQVASEGCWDGGADRHWQNAWIEATSLEIGWMDTKPVKGTRNVLESQPHKPRARNQSKRSHASGDRN